MSMTINDVLEEFGRCGLKIVERVGEIENVLKTYQTLWPQMSADVERHGEAVQRLTHQAAELYAKIADLNDWQDGIIGRIGKLESSMFGPCPSDEKPEPVEPTACHKTDDELNEGIAKDMEAGRNVPDTKPRDVGREMAEKIVGVTVGGSKAAPYILIGEVWVAPPIHNSNTALEYCERARRTIADAINHAIADEREECAKIADHLAVYGSEVANKIRKRGKR